MGDHSATMSDDCSSTSDGSCAIEESDHELITIMSLVLYVVPSFPVFSANLVEIKFQLVNDKSTIIYDGYIKDWNLSRSYPAVIKLSKNYTNAFLIDPDEFGHSVDIEDGKQFCDDMVFVIWKWEWEEPVLDDIESACCCLKFCGGQLSLCESETTVESTSEPSIIKHSLTFKCMGTTKSVRSQEILAEAAYKLKQSETVEIQLRREPSNPRDARAIAFDCKLLDQWERVGYVVREAVECVHEAIETDNIADVRIKWVRFIMIIRTSII